MSDISRYLREWLGNAVQICSGDETPLQLEVEESCKIVGQHILSLHEGATLADIHQEVDDIYNVDTSSLGMSALIEYLLVHAVSEDCCQRGEFVEGIMSLETEAQMYLMQVIQDQHTSHEEEGGGDVEEDMIEEIDEDDSDVHFTVQDAATLSSSAASTTYSERPGKIDEPDNLLCITCRDKDYQITRLQEEISRSVGKFRDEVQKVKDENANASNKIVDLEVAMMQMEQTIFSKDEELKELQGQKEKCEQTVLSNVKLQEQVLVLQDEIDLLKPQAAKLDYAEVQIDRLRAKLDDLNDIKQQLKKESASHSETFDKLSALEQEVDALRKVKLQADDYRAQFAETAIAMQELKMRLEDSVAEASELRSEIQSLRGDQSDNRQHTQHLAEELRTTAEQLREKERMNGIGEGMSELNPALMQELNRLKTENKDLFEKLDQSAVDKLEDLRKEIADVKAVNESLQKKWMSTKDALAKAVSDIQSLSSRLSDKSDECKALREQMTEMGHMASSDRESLKAKHAREVAFIRRAQEDLLALTRIGHDNVLSIYSESLAQAHTSLEKTQQELADLTNLQATTAEYLSETQNDLLEAGRKRKCLEMEHEEEITGLQSEFATSMENSAKRHKAELSELEQETQQALETQREQLQQAVEVSRAEMQQKVAEERQRTAEKAEELEQEARRRRTMERAKKTAELETQRLKLQLNAAMGADAGGDGVKSALQAITDMQQELAEAHAEIANLRTRPLMAQESASEGASKGGAEEVSSLRAPPARALRSTRSSATASTGNSNNEPAFGSLSYSGYLEQSDIAEKKIEQLTREKREQISKNLEEQRERHEVAQRLLVMEKENNALKAELRKITLEKERNDRKLNKQLEILASQSAANKENVVN